MWKKIHVNTHTHTHAYSQCSKVLMIWSNSHETHKLSNICERTCGTSIIFMLMSSFISATNEWKEWKEWYERATSSIGEFEELHSQWEFDNLLTYWHWQCDERHNKLFSVDAVAIATEVMECYVLYTEDLYDPLITLSHGIHNYEDLRAKKNWERNKNARYKMRDTKCKYVYI